MKNLFVPYEQALHLKELGFDEPCMFPYHRNNTDYIDSTHVELANYNATEKLVSAVLYQQAFRWFREKYQIYPNIVKNAKFGDWICEWQSFGGNFQVIGAYHHYEEAELACLKKLIEMVKGKEVPTQCNTFN
jgi:hypothetical protein